LTAKIKMKKMEQTVVAVLFGLSALVMASYPAIKMSRNKDKRQIKV
jgi:hypothetical protein